jgi:hypothetical protein
MLDPTDHIDDVQREERNGAVHYTIAVDDDAVVQTARKIAAYDGDDSPDRGLLESVATKVVYRQLRELNDVYNPEVECDVQVDSAFEVEV